MENIMDVETDDGKHDEVVENLIDNLEIRKTSHNLELMPNFKNFDEDYEVLARKENLKIKAIENRPAVPKPTPNSNPKPKARGKGKAKGKGKVKCKDIVSKNNQETKLDEWSKTNCCAFLTDLQSNVVLYFNKNADGRVPAWRETNGELIIQGCNVNDLMTESSIDFSTMLRDFKGSMREKHYWENFVDTFTGEEEVFFLPYNSSNSAQSKEGHHYTLLVVDRKADNQWQHFDFIGGRYPSKKFVLDDAKTMISHFGPMLNAKLSSLGIKEWLIKPTTNMKQVTNLPDQGAAANCALFVCKFMEYIALQQNIPASISETEMLELRAILSFEILSDGHESWDEESWKNEEAAVKFQMNEA
ncbi:hypothetical protein FRX31_014739 [Thalictrum thalictroides]|uniref:Ubiquitin-like protease family profile domain-containing protein n=1 Tax=Thalictrum thalictroides TaxID=46969 RepID=A0A7J6WE13_THATH|nr:hypothetical protein FRX31_014739 [Thalictrum thalictroides]